jgi:hypothetical protein
VRYFSYVAGIATSLLSSVALAGTTSVDLFRTGNTTSARMENVRTGVPPQTAVDVQTVAEGGIVFVLPNTGGISTLTSASALGAPVWKIPKGTTYPDTLKVWNDKTGHWQWAPASKMKMADYQAALATINPKAIKNQ